MLVLDSDHLSEVLRGFAPGQNLKRRLNAAGRNIFTTIVSVEEQSRGWLALIARFRDPTRQVEAYARYQNYVVSINDWRFLAFDSDSAMRFAKFRKDGIRIGSMDLKIASIVIGQSATLLTRDAADFDQVPALKHENWL